MPQASELLARLRAKYRNTDIDWEGLLEADYLILLSGRNNIGVIDIGGHGGRHSKAIQQHFNPLNLLIFEPLPEKRGLLEEMFASHSNVTVYGLALGNQSQQTTFVVKRGALEESGLRQRSFYNDGSSEDLEYIPVTIETLDNLNIPFSVDYIKIDTEGGEIDILKGATQLLRRDHPIISVEYGPGGYDAYGYKPDTLFELAEQINYSIFDLFGNHFSSIGEWSSCVSQFYWDYLLVPTKDIESLSGKMEKIRARAEQVYFSA